MADSSDVQTGQAAFGPQGKVGILTKTDSTRLLRLAILGALAHPNEGYSLRQLIRRMMPFISQLDGIMLAELMLGAEQDKAAWAALATELTDR